MEDVKKEALQKLLDKRKAERRDRFQKGYQDLNTSKSQAFDRSLRDKDKFEVVSPEFREAKVDAYRKARRQAMGKPVEEAVGDTLDYKQLRKQMSKMGRRGLKAIPLVGTVASAMMNPEDASAAIPGLDSAENVGESKELEREMLDKAAYYQSPASKDRQSHLDKLKALAKLKNK